MNINIDTRKASLAENTRYKGFGLISANGSSRLLLDYKYKHPDRYEEILRYLFGADGLAISHIKLEMGSDINSSSGTEPAVKRSEDEPADVRRGAGFVLAADAKKIAPDITLDMMWWSEPRYVTSSPDVYAARYAWYRETLIAAYETFGLKFDYVSADRNERPHDSRWTVYLSERLKSDKDAPYDFSAIKVVSGDEVGTWDISGMMLDREGHPGLLDAVDVVGSHYTYHSDENTHKLQKEYGKEVWASEGSPPMTYAAGARKFDGSGLSGVGGSLDIANRIITMYPGGGMTLYELQPAVAGYYDGATYSHKQLILANEPWSGRYALDAGYYVLLHFSRFFRKGWAFVDEACAGDGKYGGDGHALVDAVHSYMTCTDPETGDFGTVITNTTDGPITYSFTVSGTDKDNIRVWETKGSEGDDEAENFMRLAGSPKITAVDGGFTFDVTVAPDSIVTVTTLDSERGEFRGYGSEILELPYSDDLSYPEDILAERGCAPLYTTDQGGAFEVADVNGNRMLVQKITEDLHAEEWGASPDPLTCFGDDRWYNYSVSAGVSLEMTKKPSKNYAGIGLRYNLADNGASGWRLLIFESGEWRLCLNADIKKRGFVNAFVHSTNTFCLKAVYNEISCFLNGRKLCTYVNTGIIQPAGRAALYSSYNCNSFCDIRVEPVGEKDRYVTRIDSTDVGITYEGNINVVMTETFRWRNRSMVMLDTGSSLSAAFRGTGIMLVGANEAGATVDVMLDGKTIAYNFAIPHTSHRQSFYTLFGLEDTDHTITLRAVRGNVYLDAAEIIR